MAGTIQQTRSRSLSETDSPSLRIHINIADRRINGRDRSRRGRAVRNNTSHVNEDKVEMWLPMHLHMEVMPDDSHMQAFLYGPLVLAGDLGAEGLTEAHIIGPNLRVGAPIPEQHGSPLGPMNRTPPVPDLEIPSFRASGSDLNSWIEAGDKPLTFRTAGQRKDVTLVPLNSLYDRRYSVYWEVS
jgi:uncharacterized protein